MVNNKCQIKRDQTEYTASIERRPLGDIEKGDAREGDRGTGNETTKDIDISNTQRKLLSNTPRKSQMNDIIWYSKYQGFRCFKHGDKHDASGCCEMAR
jgi:hypothetical protein